MRDIALLCLLLGLGWLSLSRPWLGVLGLAVVGTLHPQGYAEGFMRHAPVFAVLFAVVVFSALFHTWRAGTWLRPPWQRLLTWQTIGLVLLWAWFALTSHYALLPWEAWDKYWLVGKILPPLLLTLWLIDSREKLLYLVVTLALCILLPAIKGGYWAVAAGFQDRVYGPPGSPYYDNNAFAVAVAMAIPLLALWWHQTRDRGIRLAILAGMALCYGAVVSSWSRGGMLALAAVTLFLLWYGKRRFLVLPGLALLAALLFAQLPEAWFGRMQTLMAYQADASAQDRLAVWRIGFDFARQHPWTGGGFNAWPVLTLERGGSLDWHSAYVEVLAEHGFVGLGLWGGLLLGTLVGLGRLARRSRHAHASWVRPYAGMLQASLAAYATGAITLGIAYWELPYHLIVLAALTGEMAARHGRSKLADPVRHTA
ncbi:MAG TPA: putative O-glycosylation ligase, exosortase A system-associated [Thiobacillaceae bacterium]|nr:putative O-glycosylation ligase, exosortase A system-associated [Thiobacillaceae bacterium]HNU64842.1 putative O-glycosylation ligase, exosortase A system-associated [Thiobacillaceae bacterium]